MAGRRNRTAPTEANGKSKDGKTGTGTQLERNRNRHEIAPPHRPAAANSWISPDGTHSLSERRNEMGETDEPTGGEGNGTQ